MIGRLTDGLGRAGAARLLQFLRFCVVGAVGFAIDAATLKVLLVASGAGPIGGRLVSFSIAVLATFELNRRWAFRRAERRRYLPSFASYLGVQGLGFICNFAVYALLLLTLPRGLDDPLICLAIASAVALAVNYTGASLYVFRPHAAPAARVVAETKPHRRPGASPSGDP